MTIAVKSHFNARSRHVFETNEQCRSEIISSRSWLTISLMRFGATRIATVAIKDDFRTISRRWMGRVCHVDCDELLGFYVRARPDDQELDLLCTFAFVRKSTGSRRSRRRLTTLIWLFPCLSATHSGISLLFDRWTRPLPLSAFGHFDGVRWLF